MADVNIVVDEEQRKFIVLRKTDCILRHLPNTCRCMRVPWLIRVPRDAGGPTNWWSCRVVYLLDVS